ncbi:hypothetical protein [Endozoicomonas sp.]|uniref:hypothetical protein n=1 Tax=Endozoicomonas sp. TaxID=1892382 RepID=UPI00288474D7|nr:hypothetical protein [Endozoicomonas sp.]
MGVGLFHGTHAPASANNIRYETEDGWSDYSDDFFHNDRECRDHFGRQAYRFPAVAVIREQTVDKQRSSDNLDIPLRDRQVKPQDPGEYRLVPMRVVDNLQQPNKLGFRLGRDRLGNKTTTQLLNYIKAVETARQNRQLPGVLLSLHKDPFYPVYQELNLSIDTSSSMDFAWRFITGQSSAHRFQRPLLQTTIDLCKKYPGMALADLIEKLMAGSAGIHNEAIQDWLKILGNRITPGKQEKNERREMAVGGADNPAIDETMDGGADTGKPERARLNGDRYNSKWPMIIRVAAGFMLLISGLGAGAVAPTNRPLGTRGVTNAIGASGLFPVFSSAPGDVSLPPIRETTEAYFQPINGTLILEPCGDLQPGLISGRPGVWDNNKLSIFCDHFDNNDAAVICAQLGYPREGARFLQQYKGSCQAFNRALNLFCNGQEGNIGECSYLIQVQKCYRDIIVTCPLLRVSSQESCGFYEPGPDAVIGRAEVWLPAQKQYGTICNEGFDDIDASQFCQELSFGAGLVETRPCPGTGPLALGNVECRGNETTFRDCLYDKPSDHCTHEQDVVVRCSRSLRFAPGDQCATYKPGYISGPVEILVETTWGAVCDYYHSAEDAQVTCAQLGYSRENARGSEVGAVCQSSDLVLLSGISCDGDEHRIQDCKHDGLGVDQCNYNNLVLSCQVFRLSSPGPCTLETRPDTLAGRPEVWLFDAKQFGTFCAGSFDNNDATAFCRGLLYAVGAVETGLCSGTGTGTGSVILNGVQCSGNERDIRECTYDEPIGNSTGDIVNSCTHENDVVIRCSEPVVIQLADQDHCGIVESNVVSGRLEVRSNDHFGTVCSDGFDGNEARVVCAQLGYSREGARFETVSGEECWGTGKIVLTDLSCQGFESSIQMCGALLIKGHSCDHSQDVIVSCRLIDAAPERPTLATLATQAQTDSFYDSPPDNDSRKIIGGVPVALGGLALGTGTVAVCVKAAKIRKNNHELSRCSLIRQAVVITFWPFRTHRLLAESPGSSEDEDEADRDEMTPL